MIEKPVDLKIPPGFNLVDTPFSASGRYIGGDKIRFVAGSAEKIGGYEKYSQLAFTGIPRGMDAWVSTVAVTYVAAGTACKLEMIKGADTKFDITPIRATQAGLTNPFTTTTSSADIQVTDVSHGAKQGDYVTFSGGTNPFNGITIDGEYKIQSVTDVDNYTITDDETATGPGAGGGTVTAEYQISCGSVSAAISVGYGVGGFGEETYGVERSVTNAAALDPRIWSVVHYGEDLIAAPNGGTIYYLDLDVDTRAQAIANAPASVNFTFVTPERYIFALGADDPMTVAWPDVDDKTDWTPSDTNTANTRRLHGGIQLVAGQGLTLGLSIVWSDSATFLFQYTGSSFIYSSRQVNNNVGLIAPYAFKIVNGIAYWMSHNGFYLFDGAVRPIPNDLDIRDFVFHEGLNENQQLKIVCDYNPHHTEIWWHYPSLGSDENDKYIMLSLETMTWVAGTLDVTATTRKPTGIKRMLTTNSSGNIYEHEVPDVVDADGADMPWSLETSLFQISNGEEVAEIGGFLPDFEALAGTCNLLIETYNRPQSAALEDTETQAVTSTDEIVDFRVSGRLFKFTLSGSDIGNKMKMGAPQVLLSGAGARRS